MAKQIEVEQTLTPLAELLAQRPELLGVGISAVLAPMWAD